jgi:hypothetical protein
MRLAALVAVLAIAACLPFVRYIGWLGDEGVMLHAAQRMAQGEHLYRDFFALLPPLPFWIVELWQRIFGPGFLAARVLAILFISGTAAATFLACVRAGGSRWVALFLSLGIIVASQGDWTVLGHRWMTALFSMVAIFLIFDDKPFAAGIFLGAALLITPPSGALAAAAALIATARKKLLLLGAAILPTLCLLALALRGLLAEAFHSVIGFMLDGYVAVQRLPFGHGVDRQSLLIVVIFPAALLLSLRVRSRAPLLFAGAGLLACLPRADVPHIAFAAPLACPLIAMALKDPPPWLRATSIVLAVLLCTATLLGWRKKAVDAHVRAPFATARGEVRFGFGADADQLEPMLRQIAALPDGASVFFYPYDPMLAYLSARRHPAPIDLFEPGYTRPEEYRASCRSLGRADFALVDRWMASPERIRQSFPATRVPRPPETAAFERALDEAFTMVVKMDRYELRKRTAEPACP